MCHYKLFSLVVLECKFVISMKKFLIFIFCFFAFAATSMEKKTTFNKDLFSKAQYEVKILDISTWIEYCVSCANQMKVLQKAKKYD